MKTRLTALVMALILIVAGQAALAGSAEDFLYTEDEQGITINYFTGDRQTVEIPEQIHGKSVVCIGDNAFANKTQLRTLQIPESVNQIGEKAFQGCGAIELLVAPGSEAEAYALARGIACSYYGVPAYPLTIDSAAGFRKMLAVYECVAAADDDGNVYIDGMDAAQAADWRYVEAVDAGYDHVVALNKVGTVMTAGENADGARDANGWTDIAAVAAGGGFTVGVKKDGTVVAVGANDNGQCDVSAWTNAADVSAGVAHTVVLLRDGTVNAAGDNSDGRCDVSGWTEIAAVSAGDYHTVGLRKDGTVVAAGWNGLGACDVAGWTDIVSVTAGSGYTVGLKSDGTLVCAGKAPAQTDSVTNVLAIAAGVNRVAVLKQNGSVAVLAENAPEPAWDLL